MKSDRAGVKKIGLLGPFGFGNLGDAAIQDAMIQHIRTRFPDAEICAFSLNPADTQARHGIPAYPITRMPEADFTHSGTAWKSRPFWGRMAGWFQYHPNPLVRKLERVLVRLPAEIGLIFQSYRNIRGLDLLVFSGGGQLDDLWGGPWKHPYVLFKFSLLLKLLGIPSVFASVGVERVETAWGKFFVKQALGMARYRSYRDVKSRQILIDLNLDRSPESLVYPDLAHSLVTGVQPSLDAPAHTPRIFGVNVIPYSDPRYWPTKDEAEYQRYLEKMVRIVECLLQGNCRLVFLTSDIYADISATDDLWATMARMGIAIDPQRALRPEIRTVEGLLEAVNGVDYVITSRLHGALLAHKLYKPVLALSYQMKIDMLMGEAGQSDYCLPVKTFDLETVMERLSRMEAKRVEIMAHLKAHTESLQREMEDQYTRIFSLI